MTEIESLRSEISMLKESRSVLAETEQRVRVELNECRGKLRMAETACSKMREVCDSAKDLHDFLHSNSGTTADWPIDLVAREEDPAIQLCDKLTRLNKALEAIDQ